MPESFEWIPLGDGTRLAVTLYLPESEDPQPAILEALPYRKDDVTAYGAPEYRRLRDEGGYAVCRIDLRGTGSSDGIARDEYATQEQADLCEAIAWIATQPWCDGAVGMYGASYSGFNSIQVAMERPPALKAIIPFYATDDRYLDDVHYYGGVRRAHDLTDYPLYMVALNALPPVPALVPEWRTVWDERIRELQPWMLRWLEEQTDGPYWRHGSLNPDYEAIVCPTMIVAGWADGYRNATLRAFEGLRCPKRMLIGPWAHTSTETSRPGPRADLVPYMLRWWDRWLRGRRNGIDEDPPIVVFVRRSTAPDPNLDNYRGEFRFEPDWPAARLRRHRLDLGAARPPGSGEDEHVVRGDVGASAPMWCASALAGSQPLDQRGDEPFSLVYDWGPLDSELEILGHPALELSVRSSAPVALVSAKLCDVFPDGSSALVARGLLNLTHHRSHSEPEPLEPGRTYGVEVELDATSWIFETGHRLRLDLAGADWPNVWSPPGPVTLTVDPAGSSLVLPALEGAGPVGKRTDLAPPRPAAASSGDGHAGAPELVWRIERDIAAGRARAILHHGAETDLEIGGHLSERYAGTAETSIVELHDAEVRGRAVFEIAWPEATVRTEARVALSGAREAHDLVLELEVWEGDQPRGSRRWERRYPRNLA